MCTANRVCTTAPLPDREKSRTRIHTAAIRVCVDRSPSNRLRLFAQSFFWCSPQDSTPAQNTLHTPHPHAREIHIFLEAPIFPAANPLNPSPSSPASLQPFPRPRAPRAPQERSNPFVRARRTPLFQTAVATLRKFFRGCSALGRLPKSFSLDEFVRLPTAPPDWPWFRRCTNAQEIPSTRTSRQFPPLPLFPARTWHARRPARDCLD